MARGTLELRDALISLTAERDEAVRRAERLASELERLKRGVEARERAWDAATELARDAVATASQAVEESEQRADALAAQLEEEGALRVILDAEFEAIRARADSLDDDLAGGAAALERAEGLIAALREELPAAFEQAPGAESEPAAAPPAPEPPPISPSATAGPWLGRALLELRREDEDAALDLLLDLFAAQSAVRRIPEPLDLIVPGRPPFRVIPAQDAGHDAAARTDREAGPAPASRRTRISLHVLLTGEACRGPRDLAARSAPAAPCASRSGRSRSTLPTSQPRASCRRRARSTRPSYSALHPAWLGEHELVVEQHIEGPRGDRWFVVVSGGKLELRDELPEGKDAPDATVHGSQIAFAHVLSGKLPPPGEKIELKGDRLALALITQWTERARRR